MPVDSGQGEHRPLAVRFDQTYAPAAVEHGAIAARGYAQGFKAARMQFALDEASEYPLAHRREQRMRHSQLAQHVRRVEGAAAHARSHAFRDRAFARLRKPRHMADEVDHDGPDREDGW